MKPAAVFKLKYGTSASGRPNLRMTCSCGWESQKTFQQWRAERAAGVHLMEKHAEKVEVARDDDKAQERARDVNHTLGDYADAKGENFGRYCD